MKNTIKLTKLEARKIILHAAGLSKPAFFGKGKEAVYKMIEHLGFVQIDTNYVVERAHHHAIFARVPNYKREWLESLQAEGKIFEFWTADAGYIPMSDFRFSLPLKQSFANKRKMWEPAQINLMNKVLDRISREGPLMARDFENDRLTKNKGWWDWRPSKVALERLHFEGKLMTLRTKNFLKIYDLAENVLPAGVDMTVPSADEYARHVVQRSLKRLGIAYVKEIAWSTHHLKDNRVREAIAQMAAEGEIIQVEVEGLKGPLYMLPEYGKKKIIITGDAFILSPFDGLNVFRHRLRDFFDFDYQIECFVPKPKRKYGYFSLPVLIGDTFVARMDSKADRKSGVLTIFNLHFEPVKLTKAMIHKLAEAINNFARFNQCQGVVIERTNNKVVVKTMQKIRA